MSSQVLAISKNSGKSWGYITNMHINLKLCIFMIFFMNILEYQINITLCN